MWKKKKKNAGERLVFLTFGMQNLVRQKKRKLQPQKQKNVQEISDDVKKKATTLALSWRHCHDVEAD